MTNLLKMYLVNTERNTYWTEFFVDFQPILEVKSVKATTTQLKYCEQTWNLNQEIVDSVNWFPTWVWWLFHRRQIGAVPRRAHRAAAADPVEREPATEPGRRGGH